MLGTERRLPARFAAFLNGLAIHADDYDDTQLATLPDRVYGLLTHPTAPVLPVALALGERDDRNGRDVLMAYHIGVEVEMQGRRGDRPAPLRHGLPHHRDRGLDRRRAAAARAARPGRGRRPRLRSGSPPARPAACARTSAR